MKKYMIFEEKKGRVVHIENNTTTIFTGDVRRQRYITRDLYPYPVAYVKYKGETLHTDAGLSFRRGLWAQVAVFSLAAAREFIREWESLKWFNQAFTENGNPWRPAFRIAKLVIHPNEKQDGRTARRMMDVRSAQAAKYKRKKNARKAELLLRETMGDTVADAFLVALNGGVNE